MDWNKQYRDRIQKSPGADYLSQVGHTEQGRPISSRQFEELFNQIVELLNLASDDMILDMCCGNGLFTQRLARLSQGAVGVDMSGDLIDIAKSDHAAPNLTYYQCDARHIDTLPLPAERKFTKVLMYAALQHFREEDLTVLLQHLMAVTEPGAIFLFGFIPDAGLADRFYDTPERRAERDRRIAEGTDPIGQWWARDTLRRCAGAAGLDCDFADVPPGHQAARYGLKAVLTRPVSPEAE